MVSEDLDAVPAHATGHVAELPLPPQTLPTTAAAPPDDMPPSLDPGLPLRRSSRSRRSSLADGQIPIDVVDTASAPPPTADPPALNLDDLPAA